MRCVDLIHELSAPTGAFDSAAIDQHLEACPQCASWAVRDAQLNRLWEATRPPELSDQAWDRIWANVSAQQDAPSRTPDVEQTFKFAGRKRWVLGFITAQAAAILVATLVLVNRQGPVEPGDLKGLLVAQAAPAKVDRVDIEPEQVVVFSMDGNGPVRDIALNDNPMSVTPDYPMLNFFESIATTQ